MVLDDSLLQIGRAKNIFFDKLYESFFIRAKYIHLAICLSLMEPHLGYNHARIILV